MLLFSFFSFFLVVIIAFFRNDFRTSVRRSVLMFGSGEVTAFGSDGVKVWFPRKENVYSQWSSYSVHDSNCPLACQVAKDKGYDRSLFSRLLSNGYSATLLGIQYRMHPSITLFPNRTFYEGRIRNGPNVSHPDYAKAHNGGAGLGTYCFVHVEGREERGTGVGGSRSKGNELEVMVVRHLLTCLAKGDVILVSF